MRQNHTERETATKKPDGSNRRDAITAEKKKSGTRVLPDGVQRVPTRTSSQRASQLGESITERKTGTEREDTGSWVQNHEGKSFQENKGADCGCTQQLNGAGSPAPQYALRRGLGVWEVVFRGQQAILKEEAGLLYVVYLLMVQPAGEPIHGLALSLKAGALYGRVHGATEIIDPVTGEAVPLSAGSELQQRSLALEEAQALWGLRRKQLELEAIVDDRGQIEPVRAEAERELEAIYRYQKGGLRRTLSVAQKAVRAVRMAMNRFQRNLAWADDAMGRPHRVLRAFGAHVESHVLIPSSRCFRRNGLGGRVGVAGSFVYEPPAGVSWTV